MKKYKSEKSGLTKHNRIEQDKIGRIQAEQELRDSETKYRQLVDDIPIGIYKATLKGNFLFVNPTFLKMTEFETMEDAIAEPVLNRYAIQEERALLVNKLKNSGTVRNEPVKLSTKNGKHVDTLITASLDDGIISGMIIDITELKQVQENLLTEKTFSETIINSMPGVFYLFNEKGKILRWNKNFERITGFSSDEFGTRNPLDFFNGENRALISELISNVFEQGCFSVEACLVSKRGGEIPYFFTGVRMYNGSEPYLVGMGIDISERKKVEGALEEAYVQLKATQSQMLHREKMASIGQLAAGVAHEINNPVGFISSNLKSMEKYTNKIKNFLDMQTKVIESLNNPEAAAQLNEERKKKKLDYILGDIGSLIHESLDGTDRVITIVQNLKSFSRVDEEAYKYADINECIESTLNIIWNEIKYKASVKKDYGALPQTQCYPQRLNQVFMNLLVNAAHAIEKQGEIQIKTWNNDGSIKISISDTGCGIPKEHISRIFEPFYTTKEVGMGTGLGLSIIYDIIKKHNGDISVSSTPGKGTSFTVTIPIKDNPQVLTT